LFLGNEAPDEVLAVFDLRALNGELIVAGTFSYAGAQQYTKGAVAAFHVARWNGATWSALGADGGTNDAVVTLHEHDFGPGGAPGGGTLVMGGWFDMAGAGGGGVGGLGGAPNGHFARWGPVCPPGDITGDGVIDVNDLLAVIGAWGACPPGSCPADLNGDGFVDVDDLLLVISNWD
jgi:hypothetical protein